MTTPEWLNLIGRIGVAVYFLWSVGFNFKAREFHLAEFKRIGIANGTIPLAIGLFMAFGGSILLLIPATIVYGAAVLIVFTLVADALFHRFWTYPDPEQMTIHKFFLFEHVALVGGMIGLAAPHI